MGDIMRQSDVLLLPLIDNEGIMKTEPLKLQSYLDAGKPVLGILNGSGRDIIEESNIGICAQPSNIEDIAHGFQSAMALAKEHSEEVKANAKKLMLDRFNKERIVNLITENLEEIAKRTKS
ncbi:MAG: glycosyltransferase [Bacteroidales bacterium]|nr:glycosyltransferase [Bacteroidales bacterium]